MQVTLKLQGPLKKYGNGQESLVWETAAESCAVEELLSGLGIPASSVSFISVDGVKVNFSRLLKGGEQVTVYPRVIGG
jgi:hypothetical protein